MDFRFLVGPMLFNVSMSCGVIFVDYEMVVALCDAVSTRVQVL